MSYQPFIDDSASLIEFTRVYLALFYTFVAGFYTVRIIYKNRSTPAGVIFPGAKFCTSWWNHMAFKFFRAAIWFVCVLRVLLLCLWSTSLWKASNDVRPQSKETFLGMFFVF